MPRPLITPLSSLQAQYVFLHDALLEVITTGWTDISIEQLFDRMTELEEEDDQGETGYSNEFNVMLYITLHLSLLSHDLL